MAEGQRTLVDRFAVDDVVWIIEVRNVQRTHRFDRGRERFINMTTASLLPKTLPRRSQDSKDA